MGQTQGWAKSFIIAFAFVGALRGTEAHALTTATASDFSSTSQAAVSAMIRTVGLGGDQKAYMPASSMGLLLGLDFGIDVTVFTLPSDFVNAMNAAGAKLGLTAIPLPKISLHKGLPGGIDAGFSYYSASGASLLGLDVKYVLADKLSGVVAVRASYEHNNLLFFKTNTYAVDLVASKKLPIIEPYVGIGPQLTSGSIDFAAAGASNLPAGVSNSATVFSGHAYVGLPVNLLILRVTGQYDYSFAGVSTYGARVSLNF